MANMQQDITQGPIKLQSPQSILASLVSYAMSADPDMVEHLIPLYHQYVIHTQPEERFVTYQEIVKRVTVKSAGVHALLPFLICDPDRGIASTAALDYAVLAPWQNTPTEGALVLIDMFKQKVLDNGPAVLGGLLMTGDRRILDLLRPVCRAMTCPEVEVMIHCRSGFLTRAMVEFYLDWLEELDSKNDCDLYGAVAAGLANLATSTVDQTVYDIERVIPSSPDNPLRLFDKWPLPSYAASIADRLRGIARKEKGQPIIPVVMSIWGLR